MTSECGDILVHFLLYGIVAIDCKIFYYVACPCENCFDCFHVYVSELLRMYQKCICCTASLVTNKNGTSYCQREKANRYLFALHIV